MKVSKASLIYLTILFFALPGKTPAQACGKYYINISIQDERGKPIKNAAVKLLPIEKDERRGQQFVRDAKDLSLFSISYPEGYSFNSFHKIKISADGFRTSENRARFLSCEKRNVTVKLVKEKSAAQAVWTFENNINVQVVGEDGKDSGGVTLTIIDSQKNSEKMDLKFGFAYFYLKSGEYIFRFERAGYQTREEKVDATPIASKNIKVKLEPQKTGKE